MTTVANNTPEALNPRLFPGVNPKFHRLIWFYEHMGLLSRYYLTGNRLMSPFGGLPGAAHTVATEDGLSQRRGVGW